jgi:hypothetical protein
MDTDAPSVPQQFASAVQSSDGARDVPLQAIAASSKAKAKQARKGVRVRRKVLTAEGATYAASVAAFFRLASQRLRPYRAARREERRRMSLTPFAEGVWLATEPVSFLGLRLTATMTVLRLGDGSLLLHSPVAMTSERRAAVEALGRVAHLYAPNTFHHLSIGQWAAAFPSARLHAPPGLAKKRADLRIDRVSGVAPEPAFDGVVDELPIEGFRLEEHALLHRPSRTLVVADLVHNIGRPAHGWTKLYTRAMEFYDRVALSRLIRMAAFSDRAAARRSVDDVLARGFDHLVVGHGAPLVGGREALAAAYGWLRA